MGISDFFKVNQFKNTIQELRNSNAKLTEQNKHLQKEADIKLSVQQMKPVELEKIIEDKSNKIEQLTPKLSQLETEVTLKEKTIEDLKAEVGDLEVSKEMSGYGLYSPHYEFATSSGYKEKLAEIRDQQKQLIKSRSAVQFNPQWTINGKLSEGKK